MKQPTAHHPLFGDIPLVERRSSYNGKELCWLQYDPVFQPQLPQGAIRGDVTRQRYCIAHHVPQYFYVDEEKTCLQCHEKFIFSGKEQKFWYETLQFNFSSTAVRCRDCRRQKQTERALREQIGVAVHQLAERPDDPAVLIDLARATVRYRERTGQGNLDRAIAAARRAFREWPASPEPLFWEGKCHQLAGRSDKARASLSRFIAEAQRGNRLAKLVAEAKRDLVALGRQR